MELFRILGTVAIEGVDKAEAALDRVGGAAKKVGKVVAAGVAAGAAAVGALTKASVASYAEYEQLFGGIEAMFAENQSAQSKVVGTAKKAWKDLTMSENDFYKSFMSAYPLVKSGIDDENEALEITNRLLTLEADLANTFGYETSEAANAINWALKGTYSYLDNLNIGISGTAEGFLEAANNSGLFDKKLKSLDDLTSADKLAVLEHYADQYGVLGRTADEAAGTIQGSSLMLKAAWQNLLVGFADENANISALVSDVMESAVTTAWNVVPRVIQALRGIVDALPEIAAQAKEKLFETFPGLEEKLESLNTWLEDIGSYAATQFQPIFEDVQQTFKNVKDAVQPIIDKLKDYVTSGEAAEDITSGLKEAIDFLAEAYETVKDFIGDVIDSIESANEWIQNHQDAVIVLATAFGTLTAAIGLFTAAQAISNAGGIVYLAQLGATAIGVYALDAAQKIATISATAFGAVMSFITSPITLVVLAIGALIAIIVLCVKHWDEIKAKAIEVAQNIAEKIEELKENLSLLWTNIMSKALALWESIRSGVQEKAENIRTTVEEKFQNVKDTIEEKVNGAKEKVTEIFTNIKEEIQSKIEEARDKVGEAIEKMKSFFDFEWNLPKIKLPHFVKTGEDSLGLPKMSVEWYKKGAVLNQPTVFGMNPATGSAMVGGEAGAEAVAPIDVLQGYVAEAVANQNAGMVAVLEKILGAILAMDANMGGNLREALDGTSFSINHREFGRLVKAVN